MQWHTRTHAHTHTQQHGTRQDSLLMTYLRSVTWAHELVVRSRPRHNTTQMGTNSIKSISLKSLILLDNKVSSISLQPLSKGTIPSPLLGKVVSSHEVVSKRVLGGDSSSSATGTWWEEEEDVWDSESCNGDSCGSDEDEVHYVTTFLVDVKLFGGGICGC